MRKSRQAMFFNIIMGIIGTILIALAAMRFQVKENDNIGFSMILFGFILTISYINYLEKKAGVSKKMIRLRVIVSIILFLSFSFFLYS